MKTRQGMTLEHHESFGIAIKQFKVALIDMEVWNAFPKASAEVRALRKVEAAIVNMQSKFDNAVCRGYPDEVGASKVYYGPLQ